MDDDPTSWIPGEKFIERLRTVNIDDDRSLEEFEEFLFLYKHSPLMLGITGAGEALHFVPGINVLSPHMGRWLGNDEDKRDLVIDIVLGVWFTIDESLEGKEDDECIFVMDDITPQLEVFLQLGAIFIADKEHQDYRDWKPSRYELVVNLEDDSLWVLRKPYVSVADAVDKEFASEKTTEVNWHRSEDMEDARIVFARLGYCNALFNRTSPSVLDLTHIHSRGSGYDNPVIATTRRTESGGIRRTNDFSFKGKKWSM